MERRMAPKERERGGKTKQNGSGETIRSSPANEQLSTRSCARCTGLLVNEWDYDLHSTGKHNVETLRCVQCGHRVDPVILQNQIRPPVENRQVQRVRQRYSMRTAC
jgi:C4-type Zn-finger protein